MEDKIKGRTGNLGNKETMSFNLKRLLDSKRMNPHQFADIMGFKYTTVMNWIKANSYPRIDKIELMARYFGVDKSDLVEEYNPIKERQSTTKQILDNVFLQLEDERQENVISFAQSELEQQNKEKITSINKKLYTEDDFDRMARKAVAFGGGELSDDDLEFLKDYLRNNTDKIKEE